ncbi:MAG: SoxR reducing system RseC family protein [Endozoicomonas sp. (ex Botrylloides leachii)]|nr:SoxR reducing system RseC family protein [Endozoicomonas sp. (ex Botrylloides leachii)]
MIEEKGVVVKVVGSHIWVEVSRQSTCSGCHAKTGCGQHLATKYALKNKNTLLCVASDQSLSEGDQVFVSISEGALLMASALVYLLPLGLLMVAVAGSAIFELTDFHTMLLYATSLAAGFMLVKKVSQRASDIFKVRVVRLLPSVLVAV